MGLLFWKNNKKIDLFAQSIADDLFSHIRPDIARQYYLGKGKIPKKQLRRVEQKVNDTLLQAQRYGADNSLGIYGSARLQKQFNDRLGELGYEIEVIREISRAMLLQ